MQPGKEGGTWLVMNKQGRIGVLLNVGQSAGEMAAVDPTSGRGFYATEWVTNKDKDMTEIFKIIKEKHGDRQQPFRLVVCDTKYYILLTKYFFCVDIPKLFQRRT